VQVIVKDKMKQIDFNTTEYLTLKKCLKLLCICI